MLKNILLPLVLIGLTSVSTIYFWYEGAPLALLGAIGVITLVLGSMYISYYIFFGLFPNRHNHPLPPIKHLFSYYHERKGKPMVITTGSVLGGLLSLALIAGGIMLWIRLGNRYEKYHFDNYGEVTTGVVTGITYHRGKASREYRYTDRSGKTYTDYFRNSTLAVGDSIDVKYSTERPVINKVVTPAEE
ncbi:MAG TPA: hypothetical protein VD996_14750 [Chitinophagaceae bacterium]|nr:hypothetical protein [Chitinophagaceae bacterium]